MPPPSRDELFAIANAQQNAGRLDEAEALYQKLVAEFARFAAGWNAYGVFCLQRGQGDRAVQLFGRAIAIEPQNAMFHCNQGEGFRRQGKLAEAMEALRRAAALDPGLAVARNNLGIALMEAGRGDEAIKEYQRAIAIDPTSADAHNNLGNALRGRGSLALAVAHYQKAITLQPEFSQAFNNLGVTLAEQGEWERAIAAYRRAIAIQPNYVDAHSNLGNALAYQGDPLAAIAACQRAVELLDSGVQAHWNLAVVLLRAGEFERGWEEYEWRWAVPAQERARRFSSPAWNGEDLGGRTILLHAEQGFGDTLQFVRYAPLLTARGARVLLECQPELVALFQSLQGVTQIFARGEPLPRFDAHCPLMSLPRALRTRLDTIPSTVPYLSASSERAAKWRAIVGADVYHPRKIGLAWAGKSSHSNDRYRSLPIDALAPLAALGGIAFHSLQVGEKAGQSASAPAGLRIIDHSMDLRDFADTAGLVAQLDLIVTVDTAVAHLAGAMGKPTWLLLPALPDWRWLLDREDSPWYPSFRLLRQRRGSFGPRWSSVSSTN